MANSKGQTAGELLTTASRDSSTYDTRDLAGEWTKTVIDEVWKCVDAHKGKCEDEEFCVVMVYADDCLLANVIRRKFYAWPFLPKPRPRQTVWLYNMKSDYIQMLWALPDARKLAQLSTFGDPEMKFGRMAKWSDYFYSGKFHDHIRKEHSINLLNEGEFLEAHREELIKTVPDESGAGLTDTFDVFKPFKSKIVDASAATS